MSDTDLIRLADAAALIRGRNDMRINLQVLQRYANPRKGTPAGPPGGERVRVVLPTVYRGGRRFTTAAAVAAWKAKCDQVSRVEVVSSRVRTARQARLDHQRSVKRLRAAGFKVAGSAGAKA